MKTKYGYTSVYLATDSPEVARLAQRTYPKFHFVTQAIDRGWYEDGSNARIEDRMKGLAGRNLRERIAMEAVADLEVMSRCDAFIGTFSSNMGRLAFELMSARKNYIPPFVSLDNAWCAGFSARFSRVFTRNGFRRIDC
ncbi:hypothetical protein CYMTET_25395 [Cymbomonas tetramitiformis]|uniref:GT23 domain-containing protein n=1 Tax=Cymbomonas tetramitiformis TaxID=36881 RepID=A0AAE0KZ84_9CHLO|nr:hypothetical protein CYMTET_25395 [Cymbomonas tetramitiformis]